MIGDVLEQMLPKDTRTLDDIRIAALHEVGHAIVAHHLGHEVRVVSILPSGETGGVTETRVPSSVPTWAQVQDIVTVLLGGRAADVALGTGAHAGAEGDLETATQLLRSALERQGLGETLAHEPGVGRRTSRVADLVEEQLWALLHRAIDIVEASQHAAMEMTGQLISQKAISGDEVARILEQSAEVCTRTRPGFSPNDRS